MHTVVCMFNTYHDFSWFYQKTRKYVGFPEGPCDQFLPSPRFGRKWHIRTKLLLTLEKNARNCVSLDNFILSHSYLWCNQCYDALQWTPFSIGVHSEWSLKKLFAEAFEWVNQSLDKYILNNSEHGSATKNSPGNSKSYFQLKIIIINSKSNMLGYEHYVESNTKLGILPQVRPILRNLHTDHVCRCQIANPVCCELRAKYNSHYISLSFC